MSKLFPAGTLRDKSGSVVDSSELAGKIVGLYFSAHWCPPCRAFTPVLADKYREITTAGHPFEIVFISSDKDAESAAAYFAEMPWKMLDFSERARKAAFSSELEVKGIPTLVLFDEAGRVLTKEGRSLVQKPFPEWKSIIEEKKRSAAEMEARIATLPESVTIAAHAHPLAKRPSVYAGQYGCDVCHGEGSGWVYHCDSCGFDAHPECACPPAKA